MKNRKTFRLPDGWWYIYNIHYILTDWLSQILNNSTACEIVVRTCSMLIFHLIMSKHSMLLLGVITIFVGRYPALDAMNTKTPIRQFSRVIYRFVLILFLFTFQLFNNSSFNLVIDYFSKNIMALEPRPYKNRREIFSEFKQNNAMTLINV